jgi:hypothetical protein
VADDGSGGDRDLGNNNGNVIPYAATLSQSPNNLYVL